MAMLDFQKLSADYQQALLRQVVPFWLKHSRDEQCGGYFDLLTTTGQVIDGDKYVTLQAQQAYVFVRLYNTFDGRPDWLNHAQHGLNFLSRFAHDATLTSHAQLDRRGRPILPATDVIPDCFLAMAYAQLHRATGEDEWAMLAKQIFVNLFQHWQEVRIEQVQTVGNFRQFRHLSESTALLQTVLEIQPLLDEESWKETVETVLQSTLHEFLDRRTDTLREYILPEGGFVNTPEGRRLNVGLTFQTVNSLLDLCVESGNRKLAMQAVAWCLRICEQAWDEAMSGLNQYVDMKGQLSIYPDWQQKWAWIQLEAILALTKGYFQTRHPDCPKWFKRIHDYTFQSFPDPKHLGWHLGLDRNNQPLLPAKAIPSVGCFSLIRCLAETAQTLTKCGQLQPLGRNVRVV